MLIGLSGRKRVGKDTAYEFIQGMSDTFKMPVVRKAFADRLKVEVWETIFKPLGVYRNFQEYMSEDNRLANRALWQFWGTEVRRLMTARNLEATAHRLCQLINVFIPSPVQSRSNYWSLGPLAWCRNLLTSVVAESRDDYWIRALEYELLAEGFSDRIVVVTDVRFPNEVRMVKELDGFCVRIVRDLPEDEFSHHTSETALDEFEDWDWTLVNEGSFEDLSEQISEMLLQLGKKDLAIK